MSMFDSYDNLKPDYVPDNSSPNQSTTYIELQDKLPRPLFDIKKRFTGYSWNHGDIFKWSLSVNRTIRINEDAIVYNTAGEYPEIETEGYAGQQAYNTVDCKSWTCIGELQDMYVWIQDEEVTYPDNGDRELQLTPDMESKSIQFDIYNFRWEPITSFSSQGSASIEISVDKELNEKLKPGVYYSTLKITGEESVELKNKYMLVVN